MSDPRTEYVWYDGSRGEELVVSLRDPLRKVRFATGDVRLLPAPECRDLLTPAIGGGAFHRCLPISQAASLLGVKKRDLPSPVVYKPRDGEPVAVELIVLSPANLAAAARLRAGQPREEVAES